MKYFVLFLFMFIIFSCDSNTEPETEVQKMYLSASNTSISVGVQTEIILKILNIPEPVFGISLQLEYDNSIINFSESNGLTVEDFFGLNVVSFVKDENSKLYLTFSKIQGESLASGSGDICKLTFTGISAGSSSIQFLPYEIYYYNSVGELITISGLEYEGVTIEVK